MSKQASKRNANPEEGKYQTVNRSFTKLERIDPEELQQWETLLRMHKATEKEGLHMYSPDIAKLLNPKQPDVAGAALFYNISLWQKNRYQQTLQGGRRYAFRSLSQLSKDCPYLSKSAVDKAIRRMEKELQKDFLIKRDRTMLWYSISDKLLRTQKKGKLLSFRSEDATFHGNIRTAVILRNLKFAMNGLKDWKRDASGNKYVRMSPTMLSTLLGYSEDTISRCLKDLCDNTNVLSRHPEDPIWYTFTSTKDDVATSIFAQNPFAVVHSRAAEVDYPPAEVDDATAKVNDSVGTDRTLYRTEYGNEDINGNYVSLTAAPEGKRGPELQPKSEGLIILENVANEQLSQLRSLTPHEQFKMGVSRVSAEQLPYDIVIGDCRNVAELIELNCSELEEWQPFRTLLPKPPPLPSVAPIGLERSLSVSHPKNDEDGSADFTQEAAFSWWPVSVPGQAIISVVLLLSFFVFVGGGIAASAFLTAFLYFVLTCLRLVLFKVRRHSRPQTARRKTPLWRHPGTMKNSSCFAPSMQTSRRS